MGTFMHITNFKTSLFVFMLIIAIAKSSIASDWIKVANTDDYSVYADMQSLSRTGPKVKVWEKWVFERPQEDLLSSTKKPYQSWKSLEAFLCDERTVVLLQITHYADKEMQSDPLFSISYPDKSSRYRNIAPETTGEILLDFVCKVTAHKK
jgi:hypothetical protein